MALGSVPLDTEPAVFGLLVERWRAMTVAERAALIDQLCADVELLARTGILTDDPDLSETEVLHQLARRRYGAALADDAYKHLLP
jgi:hypothetical protein